MSQICKKISVYAGSTLLWGSLQLAAPICQAQTPPFSQPAIPALTPAEREAANLRAQRMELQRMLCVQPIDVKVSSGTLSELVKQVRFAMPNASIELRLSAEDKAIQRQVDANEVKLAATKLPQFSFELKQTPMGTILDSAAKLSGYRFFIMPDRLLIAKPQQLTAMEQEQTGIVAAKQSNLTAVEQAQVPPLTREVSQLVAGQLLESSLKKGASQQPTTLKLSDLSPELQKKMQMAVDLKSRAFGDSPMLVPAESLITLDSLDKGYLRFTLSVAAANPKTDLNRVYAWGADVSSGGAKDPTLTLTPRSLPTDQTNHEAS